MMGFLLAGMGVVTLILVGIALAMVGGGDLLFASKGGLSLYVQAPRRASVGEEVEIILTVQNDSDEYLTIDEIRLPALLVDAAPVISILPGTLNHIEYAGESGYRIGYLTAPGEQHEFVITLLPQRIVDVVGDLKVITGDQRQATSGFRLVFEAAVARATELPQVTVQRITASPLPSPTAGAPTVEPTPKGVPYNAVVKITARLKHSSYLRDAWSGSGTIISADGLILTNAHLVSPGQDFRPDVWMVSVTDDPALPPTDRFFAEPLVVDEDLDLAVLQITSDLHYKPVDMAAEKLAAASLGDSSRLKLGDPLIIMGYPGIGGDTITLTRGDVGGFTLVGQLTEPAFIKTSAAISGGTSGGMVMDEQGHLVAVPTQLGYGQSSGELVDCRVIADTNMDGSVDQRDACIPVGGFINALRPINLAIPLINQAKSIILGGGPATPYP